MESMREMSVGERLRRAKAELEEIDAARSGADRTATVDLAKWQIQHDIAMQRGRLALDAWRQLRDGISEDALTLAELRAVLLPALGLSTEEKA